MNLLTLLLGGDIVCHACQSLFKPVLKWYWLEGVRVFVLYEKNEFLEQALLRFDRQQDVKLEKLFLFPVRNKLGFLKGKTLLAPYEKPRERARRGYGVEERLFGAYGFAVLRPFEVVQEQKTDPGQLALRPGPFVHSLLCFLVPDEAGLRQEARLSGCREALIFMADPRFLAALKRCRRVCSGLPAAAGWFRPARGNKESAQMNRRS